MATPSTPTRPRGTLRVGRIAGVDVLVRSSWLLFAGLIAVLMAPAVEAVAPGLGPWRYLAGLAFAVLLYLSVLLHEASHALTALRFGLPVRAITLHFLGGATEIEQEPDTPAREFWVSVVGPLTSLAIGGACLLLVPLAPAGLLDLTVRGLAGMNLLVGVLNLVPGLPLDGGHVLRAAVWRVTGDVHRGTIAAGWGGRVAAVLVLAYPAVLGWVGDRSATLVDFAIAALIASFLWGGATQYIVGARVRRRLPALSARELARRAVSVPEDLPLGEAVRRAQEHRAGGIVTLDLQGRPTGVVNESAVTATPQDRRPWVPVSSVARTVVGGLLLPVDLGGEQLVRAMQRTPAAEYVLTESGGGVWGVLVAEDVDRAFAASARRR